MNAMTKSWHLALGPFAGAYVADSQVTSFGVSCCKLLEMSFLRSNFIRVKFHIATCSNRRWHTVIQ